MLGVALCKQVSEAKTGTAVHIRERLGMKMVVPESCFYNFSKEFKGTRHGLYPFEPRDKQRLFIEVSMEYALIALEVFLHLVIGFISMLVFNSM